MKEEETFNENKQGLNSYTLFNDWYAFVSENGDKVNSYHMDMYCFAIQQCNVLGWKSEFGFPGSLVMEMTGINTYKIYIRTLLELQEFGFIKIVTRSTNQYSANRISIVNKGSAYALKAKAELKQTLKHNQSTSKSIAKADTLYINYKTNKQLNLENIETFEKNIQKRILDFLISKNMKKFLRKNNYQIKKLNPLIENENTTPAKIENKIPFEDFWNLYDKKVGMKDAEKKWNRLALETQKEIMLYIPKYKISQPDKKFRQNPMTFFNQESWNNEIVNHNSKATNIGAHTKNPIEDDYEIIELE